ncbi:MAG: hypothetical protein F4X98_06170 [Gammaproteobacteria bacterium]|nr:hypothetical protein [Gammaproteobacteria bacterium]
MNAEFARPDDGVRASSKVSVSLSPSSRALARVGEIASLALPLTRNINAAKVDDHPPVEDALLLSPVSDMLQPAAAPASSLSEFVIRMLQLVASTTTK